MEIVTKIINEIKDGHKFLTHWKFKLFLAEHKAVYIDVPPLSSPSIVSLNGAKYFEAFCNKKRHSPFPERSEQLKISQMYISFGRCHFSYWTRFYWCK